MSPKSPAKEGAEASQPTGTPNIAQATNSITRVVILLVAVIIGILIALGAVILPHLPQPNADQPAAQTK